MSLLQLPAAVSAALPAALPFAEEPPVYGGNAQLIAACLLGILAVVLLITWGKVHPFLALMLGSAVLGVVATMPPGDTVTSFVAGLRRDGRCRRHPHRPGRDDRQAARGLRRCQPDRRDHGRPGRARWRCRG